MTGSSDPQAGKRSINQQSDRQPASLEDCSAASLMAAAWERREQTVEACSLACLFCNAGTLRCTAENDAFAQHYRYLHKKYHMPAWKTQQQEQQEEDDGEAGQMQQQQEQQRQPQAGDGGGGSQPGSSTPPWQQRQQQQQGDSGSIQHDSREASLPAQQQQPSTGGGGWSWLGWGKR
jgi:hypothetical protein